MAPGKLRLPASPRTVKVAAAGHADLRPDWREYLCPLLPARVQPGARNGLPWRPWHWLDTRRADQRRAAEVAFTVVRVQARVAGRLNADAHAHCAADGDYLSLDLAMETVFAARRDAA